MISVCHFRLVGKFSLVVQQLIEVGELHICEPLDDINNRTLEVKCAFFLSYVVMFIAK